MAKKEMSDFQRYKPANARGAGPGAEGRAKIRAAEHISRKVKGYGHEATIFGLRDEGSRLLGEDYKRRIGGEADSAGSNHTSMTGVRNGSGNYKKGSP